MPDAVNIEEAGPLPQPPTGPLAKRPRQETTRALIASCVRSFQQTSEERHRQRLAARAEAEASRERRHRERMAALKQIGDKIAAALGRQNEPDG